MDRPLRYGFVGAGFVATFHLTALRQVRGIELAGVTATAGAPKLAALAREWGIGEPEVYDTVGEMAKHVDVIAVFAPNFARVPIVEAIVDAVKAGAGLKGVICEKPLGRNVAEARRLVELIESVNLRNAYFENQIFMRPVQTQLAQLEPVQRQMGPLSLSRSSEEHGGPHENWFWDPVRQGGGVLNDMGCHSIAVGWHVLTPLGKPVAFLEPQEISAEVGLLKWGEKPWREKLLRERGIDYAKTPAEDFATGVLTLRNPETGQRVKAQFTNSWMFEKQGLRLLMDGMGPGYAFEINTLISPLTIFIGDVAADSIKDAELALEKSTASRGLLAVQYNEAELYGYTDENIEALDAFRNGRDGLLTWRYGLEITRLVMAAYMSAERKRVIDLTDPDIQRELETYIPLIQQGRGAEQLLGAASVGK
ncbi:MAG TPA: Gfo/Idh/MocA family oxidoreductase [Vicinamibacterales bacterium]|nr:Gfo/Idh/MocA family oxidoreductase [Vicinamibacterales bacterium]